MPYQIEYASRAERAIAKLSRNMQHRVILRIEALAENPRPSGAIKLAGQAAYRIRVGDYRVIYAIADERLVVLVVDVGHRREIYRDL